MSEEIVVSIEAPHMVAGIVVRDDRVIEAAPIVRYMVGWTSDQVRSYVREKGWRATRRPPTRSLLEWRFWSCLECRDERFTVAWWAEQYACPHRTGVRNPLLGSPRRILSILERQ